MDTLEMRAEDTYIALAGAIVGRAVEDMCEHINNIHFRKQWLERTKYKIINKKTKEKKQYKEEYFGYPNCSCGYNGAVDFIFRKDRLEEYFSRLGLKMSPSYIRNRVLDMTKKVRNKYNLDEHKLFRIRG